MAENSEKQDGTAASAPQSPPKKEEMAPQGTTEVEARKEQEEAPAAEATTAEKPPEPEARQAEESSAETAPTSRGQRRGRPGSVPVGIAHIKATFNNTAVTISDTRGAVISWSTAGRSGFKGSRKSTAFAATTVAQDAARQAISRGMHEIEVRVQGAGSGRESAIRGLQSSGLNIVTIRDVTPIPHNGCRARKRRRV